MGSPFTDKQAVRLLDDRLEKKFYGGYKGLADVKEKFFSIEKSKKAWLEYYGMGNVPDPESFAGQRSYQSVSVGYHTKIEPKEFAGGIEIQRRVIDTERYGQVDKLAKNLGIAARRKMNKIAHEPFIYMDSTAFTYMIPEEGVALCSNSHTTKTNASTASGFDNLSTLPFNPTNLEALRIQSKGFKDDIGERIDTNFDTIVYGSNLAEAVWEVVKTEHRTDDMTRTKSMQHNRWNMIELPLLDDYDTNNWAIIDSNLMKDSLIWHQGLANEVEFSNTNDFDTLIRKYGSYFVCGWGWVDWRWMLGAVVS